MLFSFFKVNFQFSNMNGYIYRISTSTNFVNIKQWFDQQGRKYLWLTIKSLFCFLLDQLSDHRWMCLHESTAEVMVESRSRQNRVCLGVDLYVNDLRKLSCGHSLIFLCVFLGDWLLVQRSPSGLHRPSQTDHRPPADQTLDRHEL